MKIENANKKVACLIYTGEDYYIRIYDPIELGSLKDYKIRHSDLWFTINDEDAFLYEDGIENWIDHSPSTLGINS